MKLTLVNVNIWIGGILFDELLDFLKNQAADIVLLQEVFSGDDQFEAKQYRSFEVLQKELGLPYAHFAPAFTEPAEGREVTQGNAILSKYPLSEVSVSFYDVPFGPRDPDDDTKYHVTPRNLQHVTANISGKELHLLNTQGIWGEHGGDTERRLKMADHIMAEVGENHPLVLSGDFNVNEDTQTIRKIEAKLKNVFKKELKTSFNVKRKDLERSPGYATSVVDMFFVSEDVKILEHFVPQVDVSDHMPLVCSIEI